MLKKSSSMVLPEHHPRWPGPSSPPTLRVPRPGELPDRGGESGELKLCRRSEEWIPCTEMHGCWRGWRPSVGDHRYHRLGPLVLWECHAQEFVRAAQRSAAGDVGFSGLVEPSCLLVTSGKQALKAMDSMSPAFPGFSGRR